MSLHYLSSSSFSRFSLSSFFLFSALPDPAASSQQSSLVASSGMSWVPQRSSEKHWPVRVDAGLVSEAWGGGWGRSWGRLPLEQLYKQVQGESQLETKSQRTKQKLASQTPGTRIHHYKERNVDYGRSQGFTVFLSVTGQVTKSCMSWWDIQSWHCHWVLFLNWLNQLATHVKRPFWT